MKHSQNIFPDIKRRNLVYYILYAGILIGFAAFIVYPDFRKIQQIEKNIESVKKKISEQETLYRQYRMYMDEIHKLDKINYFNFSVSIGPEKCSISEFLDTAEKISKEHGFAFDREASGINHLPDRVVLPCSITGDFDKLRNVLIDFGKISCLEGIDEIWIVPAGNIPDAEQSGNPLKKEIHLSLRLRQAR